LNQALANRFDEGGQGENIHPAIKVQKSGIPHNAVTSMSSIGYLLQKLGVVCFALETACGLAPRDRWSLPQSPHHRGW
jgi:hypothetical protein